MSNAICIEESKAGTAKKLCLIHHKINADNFSVGEPWTCPTCGREWKRVESHKVMYLGEEKIIKWVTLS